MEVMLSGGIRLFDSDDICSETKNPFELHLKPGEQCRVFCSDSDVHVFGSEKDADNSKKSVITAKKDSGKTIFISTDIVSVDP